jgi:hypothetical protein
MLESAKKNWRISGLVPHLAEGGLTHLQYDDDIILMFQMEEESLINLKLILYCYENMSRVKINYHKSQVFVIGGSKLEEEKIAAKLICKLGVFPLIYLGIPLHTSKLRKVDLQVVNAKMSKKTEPLQGRLMSSVGRLILVNS